METFVAILYVVFGILGIILFFKVWAMTDDVKELKDYVIAYYKKKEKGSVSIENKDDEDPEFAPGTIVVEEATGRQFKIKNRLPDGRYKCSYNHDLFVTEVEASKLVAFEEYQKKH